MNASSSTSALQSDVGLCIMMHSMVEKVFFYLDEQWYKECLPEAAEAVRAFRGYGFESDLWVVESGDVLPDPEYDALYIADSERLLRQLQDLGAASCGYSHSGNGGQAPKRADYILMEPQWVDRDSLVKIWQRQRRLPWTILETARCVVREFVPEDLEAIRALYDEEAERFLEAPSEDTEKERKILEAYIDRVYQTVLRGNSVDPQGDLSALRTGGPGTARTVADCRQGQQSGPACACKGTERETGRTRQHQRGTCP